MNDFVPALGVGDALRRDFVLQLDPLGAADRLEDAAHRSAWLMISVKNPAFSNRLLDGFCRLVREVGFRDASVTIVDAPYLANIRANHHDPASAEVEIGKLVRIAAENTARCERVLRRYPSTHIRLRPWAELERGTPAWMHAEVRAAFEASTRFREDLLARTRAVVPAEVPDERLPAFAQFLVHELPVLFGVYYLDRGSIVDVYPGENPDLIWHVERGLYARELPRITALAQASDGLVYVDFRKRTVPESW